MKAVTRCLALFAATLVVGACSGDPTADDAGANLTIRATPSAIWMANDETAPVTTAELIVEAVDALGGTAPGSWTATASGPFTVAEDVTYGGTTAGQIGYRRRFVITPTSEGEGTITLAGTGAPTGGYVIPVRVAPDSTAFNVAISNLNPAIADEITVTAPAGTRFTSTTAVSIVRGATNATGNGLAAPTVVSMTADSTGMQVLPAPGATGRLRITGVANVGTPTLKAVGTSTDSITVPSLTSVATVFSNAAPAPNTAITVTMPANFKFRPTSTLTPVGAGLAAHVLSRAADSLSVTIVPVPGFNAPLNMTLLQFAPLPGLSLPLPTAGSVNVAAVNLGDDDPEAGPVANLTVPAAIGAANAAVNFDAPSFGADDYTIDGGASAQYYLVTFANAGQYTISTQWSGGADIDAILVVNNGTYGAGDGSDILAASAGTANPEAFNYTAGAGEVAMLVIVNWNGGAVNQMKIVVTRNS